MLIYIMGRPHSGSTILDLALGNSAAIESVGELVSGLGREATGDHCSCGETIVECPRWRRVREEFARSAACSWEEARDRSVRQAHVRHLLRTLTARRSASELQFLGQASSHIWRAVAAVSGKPHVLDSSKEPTRGIMLLRACPQAHAIHLVRDPLRAVASHYWRFHEYGGYFKFLRRKYHAQHMLVPFMFVAAASWTVGNLICEIGRRFAVRRTIRVRYEDLCERPALVLERIGAAFGIPLDDLVAKLERNEPLRIGHNLGGNEIVLPDAASGSERSITFRADKGKAHGLPRWLEVLTVAVCWPLMLAYGYRLRRQKARVSQPKAD